MARLGAILAAPSLRQLVAGSGTVTQSGRQLTFSVGQDFKRGATVRNATTHWTIDEGAGTVWYVSQAPGCAHGNISGAFYTSMQAKSRARGGVVGTTAAPIVPYATYFLYVSSMDDTGAVDPYTYADSLYPEASIHPYTRDKCIGYLQSQPRLHCSNPAHLSLVWDSVAGLCGETYFDGTNNVVCQGQMVLNNLCSAGWAAGGHRNLGAPQGVTGHVPMPFDDPGRVQTVVES